MYSNFGQFIDGQWQQAEKKETYKVEIESYTMDKNENLKLLDKRLVGKEKD